MIEEDLSLNKKYKKIVMIVENSYPSDPRVRKEAETLSEYGHKVTVVALNKQKQKSTEIINNVVIFRLPVFKILKNLKNKPSSFLSGFEYLFDYFYLTSINFLLSCYIYLRDPFDVIHIHNPPDILFVIGGFFRLLGVKFVFDQHEHTPELFLSRFKSSKGFIYKIMLMIEKTYLKTANKIIATNETYKKLDIERAGVSPNKVTVIRNGPDLNKIEKVLSKNKKNVPGKHKLCFVGMINPQDGVDYFIRAIYHLIHDFERKDIISYIIGKGDSLPSLKKMAAQLNIERYIHFTGFLKEEEFIQYIDCSDICIEPAPADPFNSISTPIKVMEYMAVKKPVICFDLPEIRYTAQNAAIYAIPNDEKELARKIVDLLDKPARLKEMGETGQRRIRDKFAWKYNAVKLIEFYNNLDFNGNHYLEST